MKMCTVACLFLSYQWLLVIQLGGSLLLEKHQNICQVQHILQAQAVCKARDIRQAHKTTQNKIKDECRTSVMHRKSGKYIQS
jgi:hypothetical protein